ncbi:glycerophosphodiester phosphodiesterase [Paludifilum halophilum]|nr:glycerophosphodiester phosphodiesterase [Paludifilum halophilum]
MKGWVYGILAICLGGGIAGLWGGTVDSQAATGESRPPPEPVSTWNIAHRGASAYAPESTLPAFEWGARMGSDFIELDVQMTRDGHLVALHDKQVDRTTDGRGPIHRYTLSQLKKLDAAAWFGQKHPRRWKSSFRGATVPTLEEVFQRLGNRIGYCLEIKKSSAGPQLERKLLQLLKQHRLVETSESQRVLIQSFDSDSLRRIHRKAPDLPLIQLIHFKNIGSLSHRRLKRTKEYADGIGLSYRRINRKRIHRAHRHGLRILAYTVNRKPVMRRLVRWKVDGICTNYPDRLHQVLQQTDPGQKTG